MTDPTSQHNEALFVAYTKVYLGGREWSLTIREGITAEDIDHALDLMAYASSSADNAERQSRSVPPSEAPEAPEAAFEPSFAPSAIAAPSERTRSQPEAGHRQTGGVERIVSLVVGGLIDDPSIQLWSSNDRLRFPFITTKARALLAVLRRSYPDLDMESDSARKLVTPGIKLNVTWDVRWEVSPKNDKWKDLIEITLISKSDR